MSTIGKVLIVLNLALSAAFLGWAANAVSATGEFKAKYEKESADHKTTRDTLDKELLAVRADNQQLKNDRAKLQSEKEEAVRDRDRLQADLANANKERESLKADITKISNTLESFNSSKDKAIQDKDKALAAQKDAENARRTAEEAQAKAEAAASELTANLKKANDQIADLEKERTKLSGDLKSKETELATLVQNTGASPADFMPMPKIDAVVADVNTSVNPPLVALNVGGSKGVKVGYTFEIYDGKQYKGQARVEFVHPDMCSAVFSKPAPGAQAPKQGDGASTRL